ncbi:MAG: UDP-N-acetylmuramate dehydrogenase [Gammaproteobacteria bacterium]|nr:UDP-N-acetylmuramate dehydrogenase [Gammaproteobacteria bacterium]NNF62478.1 UDP-N-acetylmuramate dehydrogenase [Gammaproteobacteria bacterium]NNM21830.1 UDP-N-acetylmuramate dehydrogenase [Gammaproteobacteria bacterium]
MPRTHSELRGDRRHDEPMAKHTSWRVGGPADLWYRPADLEDLQTFMATLPPGIDVYWVGLGSNLLVRDGGLRGAVISTHGVIDSITRLGDSIVYAESGVACAKLARRCARWGLGPAEFFAGIPGTIGGALAMNAGAFGGETWERVNAVDVINRFGELRRRHRDEYEVDYRSVTGPRDEWFIGAEFGFDQGVPTGRGAIRDLLARRKASQPIGVPSCGSVFRNPPDDYAARLIESAGLKGHGIGGAVVSDKHANFIINSGDASAADLEALIRHVRETVREKHGIELIQEVRILGEVA